MHKLFNHSTINWDASPVLSSVTLVSYVFFVIVCNVCTVTNVKWLNEMNYLSLIIMVICARDMKSTDDIINNTFMGYYYHTRLLTYCCFESSGNGPKLLLGLAWYWPKMCCQRMYWMNIAIVGNSTQFENGKMHVCVWQ